MPKSIEKPEYIKKALGLNRDAPVPVLCMDKVEQLAGNLTLNIVGILPEFLKFQKTKNSKSSSSPSRKNRKTGVYETLEEAYQRIHEERDAFLQATKKFGVPANDPLDPIEAEWISDAMMGGLIWADNEWKGYGRQQGKFQTLSDFVDHRGYALYGLFRAKRLGLDIQLVQGGKPNALIYDREARIPGTVIFGEYVHFLFKIKNQGGVAGRVAKRVLNTLWGALCQRKCNYKTLTTDQTDPFKFPEGHTLDSIIPVGSDQWRFQFTNPGNPFKGEYPGSPILISTWSQNYI
ncbi:unnamed protein product [Rhizophagus irregularis]|nr:unnamed protein product [Rhizophagus irregularis]